MHYQEPKENVTFTLSEEAKDALIEIMRLGRFNNVQQAVARAISDERYLQQQLSNGYEVYLKKGRDIKKVVW